MTHAAHHDLARYPVAALAFTLAMSSASVAFVLASSLLSLIVAIATFFITLFSVNRVLSASGAAGDYKKIAEQVAGLGIIVFLPMLFYAGLIQALLVLLVFAQLALNFQTESRRQFYLSLLLSFVLLVFSAAQSRSGGFLFYCLPYGLGLCATLFSLQQIHFRLLDSRWLISVFMLSIITIVFYLLLPRPDPLLIGATPGSEQFYHDENWLSEADNSNAMSYDEDRSLETTDQTQFMDGEGHNPSGSNTSGSRSSAMGVDNSGRLYDGILMHVRSQQPLYLKTKVFDYFNGTSWHQTQGKKTLIKPDREGQFVSEPVPKNRQTLHYEVEIAHNIRKRIPTVPEVGTINFPASVLKRDAYGNWLTPSELKAGTGYSATASFNLYRGRPSFPAANVSSGSGGLYLQVPNNLDPRIKMLANDVTQSQQSAYDKALALEHHLRTSYQYTLDTVIASQNQTPLDEFLFETQYGHCEYFASAMAVMLRTQGIPSRLVNGFSATDRNPFTGYIEVRGLDAHAWTEAYFEGVGWVPFEPTAYYAMPNSKQSEMTHQQVNEYVSRQQSILNETEQSQSIYAHVLQLWQWLYDHTVATFVLLKLLLLKHGVALLGLGMAMIALYWVYSVMENSIKRFFLKRQVSRYNTTSSESDYWFYGDAIKRCYALNGESFQFASISDLFDQLGVTNNTLITKFDDSVYSSSRGGADPHVVSKLRKIFFNLVDEYND